MIDNFPIRPKKYTADEVRAMTDSAFGKNSARAAEISLLDSRENSYKAVAELCNIANSDSTLAPLATIITTYLKTALMDGLVLKINELGSRTLMLEVEKEGLAKEESSPLNPEEEEDNFGEDISKLFKGDDEFSDNTEVSVTDSDSKVTLSPESIRLEPLYKMYKDVKEFISVVNSFIAAIAREKSEVYFSKKTEDQELKKNLDTYSKNLDSLQGILYEVLETISIKSANSKDMIRLFTRLALKLIELTSPESKEKILKYFEENEEAKNFLSGTEKMLLLMLPLLSNYLGFYRAQYVVPYKIFCACCYAGKRADLKNISTKNIMLGAASIAYEAGNLYLAHNKGGAVRVTEMLAYRTAQAVETTFARSFIEIALAKSGLSNHKNTVVSIASIFIGAGLSNRIVNTLEDINQWLIYSARQVYSPHQEPS